MTAIKAAIEWQSGKSNAELIANLAELGYLDVRQHVADVTYGKGVFWKKFKPERLVKHDLFLLDGVDSRALPEDDNTFDVVVIDLPYVATGGRDTTTVTEFQRRYGLKDAPRTPAGVQQMIDDSMIEAYRVLKPYKRGTATRPPQGIMLVKVMNYVSGGKLWPGTHKTFLHAESIGLRLLAEFHMLGEPRMQPGDKPKPDGTPSRTKKNGDPVDQKSPRNNLSTLFAFAMPSKKPEPTLA